MPSEHHHSVYPGCVPQLRTTEQELVRPQGDLFRYVEGGEEVEGAFVGIEAIVGLFGAEGAMESCNEGWGGE